jgi:hypothetical protein
MYPPNWIWHDATDTGFSSTVAPHLRHVDMLQQQRVCLSLTQHNRQHLMLVIRVLDKTRVVEINKLA